VLAALRWRYFNKHSDILHNACFSKALQHQGAKLGNDNSLAWYLQLLRDFTAITHTITDCMGLDRTIKQTPLHYQLKFLRICESLSVYVYYAF